MKLSKFGPEWNMLISICIKSHVVVSNTQCSESTKYWNFIFSFLTVEMRKGNSWHSVYEEAINNFCCLLFYFIIRETKYTIHFVLHEII